MSTSWKVTHPSLRLSPPTLVEADDDDEDVDEDVDEIVDEESSKSNGNASGDLVNIKATHFPYDDLPWKCQALTCLLMLQKCLWFLHQGYQSIIHAQFLLST